MNWFFVGITAFLLATYIWLIVNITSNRLKMTSLALQSFFVSAIYFGYGVVAINYRDEFALESNSYIAVGLKISLIVSVLMGLACLVLYLLSRPSKSEDEQAEWAAQLKRLRWRPSTFDREGFKAEWRHPLTHHRR